MSELNINIQPQRYYIHEKATYDAMLAAGEIIDGVEYWIKETGEIHVFDGKFGGGATADSVLSDKSENPVQNKVVKAALDNLTKEVVDNEEVSAAALAELDDRINKIDTVLTDGIPETYATKESVESLTKEVLSNEEVTAAALTDLDNRVNEKQDVLKDGENIKTINGESILGEGNIEIQGGGNGGGAELLEIRYNWDGTELTDEDKAVNAATYTKLLGSKDYILYNVFQGLIIYASILGQPSSDSPFMAIGLESKALSFMGQTSKLLTIDATGTVVDATSVGGLDSFAVINIDTSSFLNFNSSINNSGITTNTMTPVLIQGYVNGYRVFGITSFINIGTEETSIYYKELDTNKELVIFAKSDDSILIVCDTFMTIALGSSDEESLMLNRTLFYNDRLVNINSAKVRYALTYYSVISYEFVIDSSSIIAYKIVIYRNNTFETWQINADGTTQQITQ